MSETIGPYAIRDRFSSNRWNHVVLAQDRSASPDLVVVKYPRSGDGASRVQREAAIHEHLRDRGIPHIVPLRSVGTVQDDSTSFEVPIIVTAYARAGSIKAYSMRRNAPLSLEEGAAMAGNVAAALNGLHELGLAHRDLKPRNVLISEVDSDRRPTKFWLADFGEVDSFRSEPREASSIVATPSYIAPEELGDVITPLTDAYGLGLTFIEAVTGEEFFPMRDERDVEVHTSVLVSDAYPGLISNKLNTIPRVLQGPMWRVLRQDPTRRSTVTKFVEEINTAVQEAEQPQNTSTIIDLWEEDPTGPIEVPTQEFQLI